MNLSTPNTRHLHGHHGTLAMFVHDGSDGQGYKSIGDALINAGSWIRVQEQFSDIVVISATPQVNPDTETWEVVIVADVADMMEEYDE